MFFIILDGTPPSRFKRSLVDLLEYSLVAGWEWWDIMVAAHLGAPAGQSGHWILYCQSSTFDKGLC